MKNFKVVLYLATDREPKSTYPANRTIHHELEKRLGEEIDYVCCWGDLIGYKLEKFVMECEGADLVILDAWATQGSADSQVSAKERLALVALEIKSEAAPNAVIIAQLLDGNIITPVHKYAKPFEYWTDEVVMSALLEARARSNS